MRRLLRIGNLVLAAAVVLLALATVHQIERSNDALARARAACAARASPHRFVARPPDAGGPRCVRIGRAHP
jgi:hypothetical protein